MAIPQTKVKEKALEEVTETVEVKVEVEVEEAEVSSRMQIK